MSSPRVSWTEIAMCKICTLLLSISQWPFTASIPSSLLDIASSPSRAANLSATRSDAQPLVSGIPDGLSNAPCDAPLASQQDLEGGAFPHHLRFQIGKCQRFVDRKPVAPACRDA